MDGQTHTHPPSIDRLSALPDDLICHVLSFLPTKTSVSTSVLAKRWRLLWAHVPKLVFDSEKQNIINRVMMRLKVQDLKNFRLSNGDCSSYDLESWITTLIDRNVQRLIIHMTKNPERERKEKCEYCYDDEDEGDMEEYYENLRVELPRRLFTCKTLVELSLANCRLNVPMTGTIYLLPALMYLCLKKVKYGSDDSLPRLLSFCPVLKRLVIMRYRSDEMRCCYISSPKIKYLFLRHLDMCELQLDTPALTYLKLRGLPKNPSLGVLPSLTEAFLSFNPPRVDDFHKILQFVSGFKNVNSLLVSFCGEKVPDSACSALNIIKFHNLTQLELNIDYRLIPKFIESADNLRVLTISFEKNDLKCWVELEKVPACLVSNLEILKIVHFGCTKEQEFNVVRYFLRNAKVLKKMEISCKHRGFELEKINEAHNRFSFFERVSEACELVFL